MFQVSRSFRATQIGESTPPEEFSTYEPDAITNSVVSLHRGKEEMMVAFHEYPRNEDSLANHHSHKLNFDVKNWSDIGKFLKVLNHHRKDETDMERRTAIGADTVELEEVKYPQTGEDDIDIRTEIFEDVSIEIDFRRPIVEFAIYPEPDRPVFPIVPVGDEYSLGGGASNQTHLKRLEELLREATEGIEDDNHLKPVVNEGVRKRLNKLKYGAEVLEHIQDGDYCFKNNMNHLALSSYIHAIEWVAIAYLETEGVDVIEEEKNGNLYYFAGGENSILDELNRIANIEQKTLSKIKSMNRAERRWMAHHKTGDVLPSEVKAVRDRLSSIVETLYSNN